jgi:hypothetical protein
LGIVFFLVYAKIRLMKKGTGRIAEKAEMEGQKGNYF